MSNIVKTYQVIVRTTVETTYEVLPAYHGFPDDEDGAKDTIWHLIDTCEDEDFVIGEPFMSEEEIVEVIETGEEELFFMEAVEYE